MTEIKSKLFFKHLRSESNMHIRRFRNGRLVRSGKGLSFWFLPMGTSIDELPTDDREVQFYFQGRTKDFQEIGILGDVIYRVTDPDCLADRVDFSIDQKTGRHRNQPLEQIAALFTNSVQKHANRYIATNDVRTLIQDGPVELQQAVENGFEKENVFAEMGLAIVSMGIKEIKPGTDLEKAMQTPTREGIQQDADKATFQRRALAVEKERAIAENELQSRIELAAREESLISQQGANERRRIEEQVMAQQTETEASIQRKQMKAVAEKQKTLTEAESESERQLILSQANNEAKQHEAATQAESRRIIAAAEADAIRDEGMAEAETRKAIGLAEAAGEIERMSVYENLPANVVFALALQEVAGKLKKIEHINITPDILKTNLADLFSAGADQLQKMGDPE